MPIKASKATFYQECEICQEKFWDEDIVAYLIEKEINGELVSVCLGCLSKRKKKRPKKNK